MSELKYPISIRPLSQNEGGGYIAEFPDLPGCVADGQTIEEAVHEAEDALQAWICSAKEFNDPIPKPTATTHYSGQWRIRVPKSLHAALAALAKKEGVSLNSLAMSLLAQGVGQKKVLKNKAGH